MRATAARKRVRSVTQRRVILDERLLVTAIADRIDQALADPRALVILWRMVTGAPPLDGR